MTSTSPMVDPALRDGNHKPCADYQAQHFLWNVQDRVGTITLNRPERKNPLTFASYAELRDLFQRLKYADDVKAIVVHGAGDNFCSGGDVHDRAVELVEVRTVGPEVCLSGKFLRNEARSQDGGRCQEQSGFLQLHGRGRLESGKFCRGSYESAARGKSRAGVWLLTALRIAITFPLVTCRKAPRGVSTLERRTS